MSSAHHITFLNNIEITNENFREILFDPTTGEKVASDFSILDDYGVTKSFALSSKSLEHIFVGVCEGCSIEIKLQMSPDNINWCDCILADGSPCKEECSSIVGDCKVRVVDVPLLQYVRLHVGIAGSLSEPQDKKVCTVNLHYTLD